MLQSGFVEPYETYVYFRPDTTISIVSRYNVLNHVWFIMWDDFLNQASFVKIYIGATIYDFCSGVLMLKDGTCLTSYKLNVHILIHVNIWDPILCAHLGTC